MSRPEYAVCHEYDGYLEETIEIVRRRAETRKRLRYERSELYFSQDMALHDDKPSSPHAVLQSIEDTQRRQNLLDFETELQAEEMLGWMALCNLPLDRRRRIRATSISGDPVIERKILESGRQNAPDNSSGEPVVEAIGQLDFPSIIGWTLMLRARKGGMLSKQIVGYQIPLLNGYHEPQVKLEVVTKR